MSMTVVVVALIFSFALGMAVRTLIAIVQERHIYAQCERKIRKLTDGE